jgi:hypothetical protein
LSQDLDNVERGGKEAQQKLIDTTANNPTDGIVEDARPLPEKPYLVLGLNASM